MGFVEYKNTVMYFSGYFNFIVEFHNLLIASFVTDEFVDAIVNTVITNVNFYMNQLQAKEVQS